MSFCPAEAKAMFSTSIIRVGARDWWGEVIQAFGAMVIKTMSWKDFNTRFRFRFRAEYIHAIEVKKLAREFLACNTRFP